MFESAPVHKVVPNISEAEIKALNKKYQPLTARERIKMLYEDFNMADVMLTSSFAATSAFLLKLISDVTKKQDVFFIDTGYHFEDTDRKSVV